MKEVTGLANKTSTGLKGMINSVSSGRVRDFGYQVNCFCQSVDAEFSSVQDGDCALGPHDIPIPIDNTITVEQVEQRLQKLDARKGASPDGIPTWVPRDFAPVLAAPICVIFNNSIKQSVLPTV